MPNNESNWTTVSGKPKPKAAATSAKPSGIPVIPKAEIKSKYITKIYEFILFFFLAIKLSDSAFSSMKERLHDENDENQPDEPKSQKTAAPPSSTSEKNPPVKINKPNKPTSTSLTLKQALQNVNFYISRSSINMFYCFFFS